MNSTFLSRLHAAASLVFKSGAPFPFNKIMPYDATGGERMYRAFEQSTWVMRAIKKIAGPIAAVDLNFTRAGERFHQAELEAFWESPGAGMTRTDLIEATVGWLKLEGEAFWLLDDSWLAPFPRTPGPGVPIRSPLVVARPDRMRHVVKNGALEGWEYVDEAGKRALLLPEQVVQLKMWNPYNDWRGLAELKPCRDAAEADYLAGKFNLNLMRNNGDQGVYVIAKEGLPQDGQRQQIVDQIREKRELAQRGVFKPVFLDGDVTIEDPKIRVPDADFIAARLQNRHEVFIAMGVPASMADVKASYSIGSASDWFMLIAKTCIPLGEKICQGINQVLRRQGAAEVRASLNWDEHPVIQAVRRERADTAGKYFAMGVPLKALNDYLDLELPACPGWEKAYVPTKLGEIGEEAGEAAGVTMDDTVGLMRRVLDPVERLKRILTPESAERERDGNCGLRIADCGLEERSSQGSTESRPTGEEGTEQRGMMKGFVSRFNRELMKARTDTLRRLEGNGAFVFDTEGFARGLAAGLRPVVREMQNAQCIMPNEDELREFLDGREAVWRAEAERIGREIETAAGKMQNAEGKMQNAGPGADAVRAKFNEIAKRRAPELARMEMQNAECIRLRRGYGGQGMQNEKTGENCGLGLGLRLGLEEGSSQGLTESRPAAVEDSGSKLPHSKATNTGFRGLTPSWVERATRPSRRATGPAEVGGQPLCKETPSDGRMSPPVPAGESPTGTGGSPVPPTGRGMGAPPLRRLIHPEVRVVDARRGIVDYIASDESIDSYKEVIRAAGWRFTHFARNAPFVDSHDYSTIGKCLGKVIDFRVEGARLIERVQWALDVPENQLAQIGWKMTEAGYLKAVSVGFFPVKYVTPNSGEEWTRQLKELGLPGDAAVRTIYTEQEQVELSCCVVGSNPNALARAWQAGAINDADIETLSLEYSQRENGRAADCPAPAAPAREQARAGFLEELHKAIKNEEMKL
jgi:phage portal protein BeeE